MNIIKSLLVLTILIISTTLSAQDKMANNIDNSNIELQRYSPVSYLDLGLAQSGNKEFKSEFGNVIY
jgi:hypothetical protein